MNDAASNAAALDHLQEVLNTLLSPEGCPWDKTQTPQTLCDYIIEEAFELVDSIRAGDAPGMLPAGAATDAHFE